MTFPGVLSREGKVFTFAFGHDGHEEGTMNTKPQIATGLHKLRLRFILKQPKANA
jgi:hypothetical protein